VRYRRNTGEIQAGYPKNTRQGGGFPVLRRRWLQDTSKRKLADFSIFYAPPPFLFPRVYPRLTRRLIKTGAPEKKYWVDSKLLAGFTRKKASTCRVNQKIAIFTRNQRVFFSRYLAANYGELNWLPNGMLLVLASFPCSVIKGALCTEVNRGAFS